MVLPSDLSGAPYPGAPLTYVEAQRAGVALRAQRWGLVDVAVSILLALIVPLLVLGTAIAVGAPVDGAVVLLGSATLPWVGFGLWPWLTTRIQGNGAKLDLGYTVRRIDLAWGLGGGLACLVLGTLVATITQALVGEFDSAAGAAVVDADVPRWVVLVFAACALVGAPLFEELCFRGLAFAAVAKWAARRGLPGVPWATIVSAVLFTIIHLEPVRIPVLLTIGLVLSLLRARTGRVGASVIAHAFNNFWGVLAILSATA
jgi:membrane protease YdiL (CAAX protease family)